MRSVINKRPTCISLCSGYSGIELGLKRLIPDLRTVMYSEIEAYACLNLIDKMEQGLIEPAPIWTNLKTFPDADVLGFKVDNGTNLLYKANSKKETEPAKLKLDILTGGFP